MIDPVTIRFALVAGAGCPTPALPRQLFTIIRT